jgi:hypothetical protein
LLTRTGGWTFEEPPESAGVSTLAAALTAAFARSDFGALAVAREPASFLAALADAVTFAMYCGRSPTTAIADSLMRASPTCYGRSPTQ